MAGKDKKPEIRFTGFTDAWEQCKVQWLIDEGIIEEPMDGNHGEKHPTASEYVDYGIPFLMATDIKNGIVDFKKCNFITIERSKKLDKGFAKNGDVLITHKATIGEVAILSGLSSEYAVLTPQVTYYRVIDKLKLAIMYLYAYFNSPDFQNSLKLEATQSTRLYIGITRQHKLDIKFPKAIKEQEKIGECFSDLDNLITLYQRKCDKLVIVKKSMLEKMFPKDGADVPEIRFGGFTDAWEQRKLGDVTFPSGVKNSDNIPYESYSISNENGFVPQNEQFEHGGTMRDADKSMYYIVSPQSFAYNPARINVGSIGYQNLSKSVIVSSLYEVFKTTDECDDGFLWYWIKTDYFQKLIERYQEGGVRLYFYYDKFCKGTLPLPTIGEQHKIGVFFSNLDNLITLHQRELEKLKNIKKSMLEKMFV